MKIKLLFLLFITQVLTAQDYHTGRVVDSEGAPIYNASVFFAGTVLGAVTDEQGVYRLEDNVEHDTIQVSSLGYCDIVMPKKEWTALVTLEKQVFALKEFKVHTTKNKRKKQTLENGKSRYVTAYGLYTGLRFAIPFDGCESNALLKSVKYYTVDVCDANKLARIRVMSKDAMGLPLQDLMPPLIVKNKKKSWNKVDFSEFNINVEDDFFIVLESLNNTEDCFWSLDKRHSHNVSVRSIAVNRPVLLYFYGHSWQKIEIPKSPAVEKRVYRNVEPHVIITVQ